MTRNIKWKKKTKKTFSCSQEIVKIHSTTITL